MFTNSKIFVPLLLFRAESSPDEIVPVLEDFGFTLHSVVWESQTPGIDQQDGKELALPSGCHLLFVHGVCQGEQEEDTSKDGTGTLRETNAGAGELPRP